MTEKTKYRAFCELEKDLPVFMQAWWLDCTAGLNNWDAIIIESGGNIQAVFPYFIDSSGRIREIKSPRLTPRLGPYIKYPGNQKYSKKLGLEKKIINQIVDELPGHDYLRLGLNKEFTNWLPFHWQGFSQSTNYTYILRNLKDKDEVYKNFSVDIRREIKKAGDNLEVKKGDDIQIIHQLNELSFKRQKLNIPYSLDFLERLDKQLVENGKRSIYYAEDGHGAIHSAIFIVFDAHCAYYLIGGSDPGFRTSGAMSLLLWEAIKDASEEVDCFDFEGSMIESIERYFRDFGAVQEPYHVIRRIANRRTEILLSIKTILTGKKF